MLDAIVGQFLGSSEGAGVLEQLKGAGLSENEARNAAVATAEGATQQASGGGLAGLASSFLGGGGGLGGLMGGGGGNLASLAGPVSEFVATKTGLPADKARMAVEIALPKVLAFARSRLGGGEGGAGGGMLGKLFG